MSEKAFPLSVNYMYWLLIISQFSELFAVANLTVFTPQYHYHLSWALWNKVSSALSINIIKYEPCLEKTCLQGL